MTPDIAPAERAAPPSFTGLDWVALAAAAWAVAGLLAFPVGHFETMFRDFGALDTLPLPTRFVLWPWSRGVLALPAFAAVALGFRARRGPSRRRTWFVVAVALGLVGAALCLVSMYLPIFALADAIKAE
jgi:type II secretory pathway component PulF